MTSTRDSRAEARKAWGKMRRYLPRAYKAPFPPAMIALLESLARREYEAGYRDGQNDLRRNRLKAAMEKLARRRG